MTNYGAVSTSEAATAAPSPGHTPKQRVMGLTMLVLVVMGVFAVVSTTDASPSAVAVVDEASVVDSVPGGADTDAPTTGEDPASAGGGPLIEATLFLDDTLVPRLVMGSRDEAGAAHAAFRDTRLEDGWTRLDVKTTGSADRGHSMYAAGYLEGALTQAIVWDAYRNVFDSFFHHIGTMPLEIRAFLDDQLLWMRETAEMPPPGEEEYWEMVQAILSQLDGLVEGYNDYAPEGQELTTADFYMMSSDGDMEDVAPAANHTLRLWRYEKRHSQLTAALSELDQLDEEVEAEVMVQEKLNSFRCSALVKLAPENADILHSHDTWDTFSSMVRVLKRMEYNWSDGFHRTVSFSSSPAFLSSIDDWFQTDAGLVVIETTNGVYNATQIDMISPHTTASWVRALAANMLAESGPEWAEVFSLYNSGTYNNQWMVLDLDKFVPGELKLKKGLFTVLEQIPEFIEWADQTHVLQEEGYWASYNVPYFQRIKDASGFSHMEDLYGDEFSHEAAPRAKIFHRDAPSVSTLDDLKTMMRYNDWQHDPLSLGDAGKAISARFDLSTGPDFSMDGGIDSKVATVEMSRALTYEAVNGPTHDQQPVFRWTPANEGMVMHHGQPEVFDFEFVPAFPPLKK